MRWICAATSGELAACPEDFAGKRYITGVGIPATFAQFIPLLREGMPSLIVNIGIAGAYPDTLLAMCDIVLADGDIYGDVGMELPTDTGTSDFLPIAETDFGREFYVAPFAATIPDFLPRTVGPEVDFRVHSGRGCTVNTCTGTNAVGVRRAKQTGAVFETMEGAAVLQIGQMYHVPVCQIRAISNIAANREMRPENIRRALANLRRYLEMI